jgi:hypothetical protein
MSHLRDEPSRRREIRVFSAYLLRKECPDDVAAAYLRYHDLHPMQLQSFEDDFDRLLMFFGRFRLLVGLLDAYAAVFRPQSMLRKRLVLFLALLECMPEYDQRLQCARSFSRARVVLAIAAGVMAQISRLIVGVPILAPLDLMARSSRLLKADHV